jgi:hypothetical protein
VPERVEQARRFTVFATALVLLSNGGGRPLARAIPKNAAVAINTLYKWSDIDRAPKTILEGNAFLNRLAIYARAELRKGRVRIAAERGSAGDRRVIFAYLLGISGQDVSDIPSEYILGFPGNVVDWFVQQLQPIRAAMSRIAESGCSRTGQRQAGKCREKRSHSARA